MPHKSLVESPSSSKKKHKKSLKSGTDSPDGEFQVLNASLTLSVPPIFADNPRAGVEEMLDSMVMRYIPAFQGVVLSHSNLSFINKRAVINADCPFLVCKVGFDATIWSPKIGLKVVGKINLCSPDHVSVLIHRTFNASIPRHHIPINDWHFEYGPAENDPEFGSAAQENGELQDKSEREEQESAGKWVNQFTGERLGGEQGYLEFTVVGLTVANEMLSLRGSIQPDPFSPVHATQVHATARVEEPETDIDKIEAELEEDSEVDELPDTMDALKLLGQKSVTAVPEETQQKRKLEKSQQSEVPKKKKRKDLSEESLRPHKTKRKKSKHLSDA